MSNTMETVLDIQNRIKNGERVLDIAQAYEKRARADTRNIFREIFNDIEAQAMLAQKMVDEGRATDLTGVPIALKDNILCEGHIADACSKMLEHYTASYDSTVVKILKEKGAIFIGRTNMDDGAMGSSTENSAYGVTKNPIDETRVPGGSSGGSAAAVVSGLTVLALGSDTGGSIRQPAAFCGIVGLLPTYGAVSRHGLIAMGSSFDVVGPMASSVNDAELLFNTINQYEPLDSTSVPLELRTSTKTQYKKLAIPKGIFGKGGIDPELQKNFEEILSKLKGKGYQVDEVDIPHFSNALAVYYILIPAEISSNLARLEGVRYGDRVSDMTIHDLYTKTRGTLFGPEVKRRILLGTYILSHGYYDAYYNKAVAVRAVIRKEVENILESYDAIITPTTPTPAFSIGEKINDPVSMYLSDLFTVPANIAQHPALSVPCGKNSGGLPFGIQCIGARFNESGLFTLGRMIENIR